MHAGARLGSQWTRRKPCVQGPLRRAHPASGATWNVQVVKGKVTSRCLWHACRALSLGLLLMVLGAAMATIGYYADHLSIGQEIRGNATVRVKNESRGFHLNNLSYAGPIVMGVGGFIVVAACVMTFEARDSAAKVMPARMKGTIAGVQARQTAAARRCTASQTGPTRWDHHLGVFRSSPSAADRKALTAAFLQFSKHLSDNRMASQYSTSQRPLLAGSLSPAGPKRSILRSGSVPNLECDGCGSQPPPPRIPPRKPLLAGCALLNPAMLPRQALSVDESHVRSVRYSRESLAGSQGSMAMDLHVPNDGPITLRVRDRSRTAPRTSRTGIRPMPPRSDTARRHMLSRQKQIIDDEEHNMAQNTDRIRDTHSCSPHLPSCQRTLTQDSTGSTGYEHRRSSNASDTAHSRRNRGREVITPARSASTSPHPRRSYERPPPTSLDLSSSHPISEDDPCDMSPDLVISEYHTVCEDQTISTNSNNRSKPIGPLNSTDSRDSRLSTETGTLHTAENICEDGMTEYDIPTETPNSITENDESDLTEDITPTFDSDFTSSKNDDNDSTVIDVCPQDDQNVTQSNNE